MTYDLRKVKLEISDLHYNLKIFRISHITYDVLH